MNKPLRYLTDGHPLDEFQAGSDEHVLKNLLGITSLQHMEQLESLCLSQVTEHAIDLFSMDHRFTVADLLKLNHLWLGQIYPWAGQFRTVRMSKNHFPFAFPEQIPRLMEIFTKDQLNKYTPCHFSDQDTIAYAIAETHVEFLLIHPFREGNGRMARLLSTLMALQAGLPLLDFTIISTKENRPSYIRAVQFGLERDYRPMKEIFLKIIRLSERLAAETWF